MKRKSLGLVAVAVWFVVGCGSSQLAKREPSSIRAGGGAPIETEAKASFAAAEKLFSAKQYDKAIPLYHKVRSKFPHGRAAMMSTYRIGTINYYKQQYAAASREFEYFLGRYSDNDLTFDIRYSLAAAEFGQGNYDKANQVLSTFRLSEIQAQGPRRAEVVYRLAAQTAGALGNHASAVGAYALQMQLPLEEAQRHQLESKIDSHLNQITRKQDLDRLLREVTEPTTRGKIEKRISELVPADNRQQVHALAQNTESSTTAERQRIGVVLPLSGRWSVYGKRALQGILLASQVFTPNGGEFELHIRDTESNPLIAAQSVDELVQREGVFAIIGPFNWSEALVVAERASALGVVNISLTAKEGISEKSPFLFQNAITPRVQLDSLARFAIQKRNFQRFAIVRPENDFGEDMKRYFWDAVESYGGRVVASQKYSPGEKDFQTQIQQLLLMLWPKYRPLEWNKINEAKRDQKAKNGKEPKLELTPLTYFDAIFIPDSPKTVVQIVSSLAYYDATHIPILGTTEWDSPALYQRAGSFVTSAVYPAGLSARTRDPKQQNFIRRFSSAFGENPDLLAAQSYEAMEIVINAIRSTSSNDRSDLASYIAKRISNFDSPLGNLSFDSNRVGLRQVHIMQLTPNSGVQEY